MQECYWSCRPALEQLNMEFPGKFLKCLVLLSKILCELTFVADYLQHQREKGMNKHNIQTLNNPCPCSCVTACAFNNVFHFPKVSYPAGELHQAGGGLQ